MRTAAFALCSALCLAVAAPPAAWSADAPQRPRITGIAHIALYVHDMEKARAYYKDFLGFGEPYSLNNPNGQLSMTFLRINDRQYVELFPETAPATDRLNHIGVETDDAEAMRLYLAAKGVKVPGKVSVARIGNKAFTVKDPDGHTVEFVEYTPAGWSMREMGRYMPGTRISQSMMHVGIIVGRLEAAKQFYGDILGFREFWRGSKDEKQLSWVNMRVPDGDTYIEFMLYDQLPAATARGSQHHLCLEVPDIAKAKASLVARPAARDYKRPLDIRTGINRKRQLNLYDPDGTRSELMEGRTVDGVPAPSSQAPPPH